MNRLRQSAALLCAAALCASMTVSASAAVKYMPDVTEEMAKPSFWSEQEAAPDAVLADADEIDAINEAILHGSDTKMFDLANWPERTFDAAAFAQTLREQAEADAKELFDDDGAVYLSGEKVDSFETAKSGFYAPIFQNVLDPDAAAEMPIRYAICTTRTCLRYFPTDEKILDDPDDYDFDYLYETMVRVGEPLIVKGESADGAYYYVYSSCYSGWVRAADVALCADREEWLKAWQFKNEETLVVYDDKIYTEDSNTTPQTANRKLPMGTCLKLADPADWKDRIGNRSGHNNYVVWMPVRQEDGSYTSELALISQHCKVSEGYLPLTYANVAKVALNQLGDTYGWGGMLGSDDCSGFVRDVYKCFGLELARDTGKQAASPVRNTDLSSMSDEEKTEAIKQMPLGTILFFKGHEMLYLGHQEDKLYVISSVSSAAIDGTRVRLRNTTINTLDIQRPNKTTWLSNLYQAQIPYYQPEGKDLSGAKVAGIKDTTYTGKAIRPKVTVTSDGKELTENVHYTLSCADNKKVGTASVTITGKGNYAGEVKKTFKILPKGTKLKTVKGAKGALSVTWNKQTEQTDGYQIQYNTQKQFKSGNKTVTVKGSKTATKKIGKLKANKTYYVRIRTYKTVGDKRYYSGWSAIKSVKTK